MKLESARRKIFLSHLIDNLYLVVSWVALSFSLGILISIFYDLFSHGAARLTHTFFTSFPSRNAEEAGILAALVGTFCVAIVTASFTVPIGVATAIYLEEYRRKSWMSQIVEVNIMNLAGVPSIIYGLLGLGIFVYQLKLGQSIVTGGLILGLLVLPVLIVTTREALRSVPQNLREAAYALGATKWEVVKDHVLPAASGGIFTGIIISISRAIGETAPLVTIGALSYIAFLPHSPFIKEFPFVSFAWLKDPFTVLPIQMFNWISRPEEEFHVNAAATGLVLIFVTFLLNTIAIYLRFRFRKRIKW